MEIQFPGVEKERFRFAKELPELPEFFSSNLFLDSFRDLLVDESASEFAQNKKD